MNGPREIPYDFWVVLIDEVVWLYDNSTDTYLCSAVPCLYLEPAYWDDGGNEELPDPSYFERRFVEKQERVELSMDLDDIGHDVEEEDAWEAAREEASVNYYL